MKTLLEVLKLTEQFLRKKEIPRAKRLAEDLVAYALRCGRLELYMAYDRPVDDRELELVRDGLKRSLLGEPLEYIFKQVQFFHCPLNVTPSVLIPRQETEILLSKIVAGIKDSDLEGKVAWDLCTGSGCLGVGLKRARKELSVVLSDVSQEALEVAKSNVHLNNLEIECRLGDLFAPFEGEMADFIICNPPYIAEAEYPLLDRSVRDFEPRLALVGGGTGFEYYERVARDLSRFLRPGGKAFFEIGTGQGEAVLNIFLSAGFSCCRVEKDWADHDRFFFLELE